MVIMGANNLFDITICCCLSMCEECWANKNWPEMVKGILDILKIFEHKSLHLVIDMKIVLVLPLFWFWWGSSILESAMISFSYSMDIIYNFCQ